jgi:hypothetical protein
VQTGQAALHPAVLLVMRLAGTASRRQQDAMKASEGRNQSIKTAVKQLKVEKKKRMRLPTLT